MRVWRGVAVLIVGGIVLATLAGCAFFGHTEAVIVASTTSGVVPLTVTYSGEESSGPDGISTYYWTFGTGDERYTSNGSYTYEHAGRYSLTLVVRSADGATATAQVEIVVEPAVWICDENLDRVYKLDMDGAVLKTFDVPVSQPRGIALGTASGKTWVFVACYGGGRQRILRIDQMTGEVAAEHTAPAESPLYLAFGAEEPQRLWHIDGLSRKIYGLNPTSGQVLDSFGVNFFRASQQIGTETFLQTPQGLCWTRGTGSAGALWYLEGETKLLYRMLVDPPINIFEGIQLEMQGQPVAVDASLFPIAGMDGYEGTLWVVDRDAHEIVGIDPASGLRTGDRITGFPGAATSGLAIQQ